jgi:hypothetical protein
VANATLERLQIGSDQYIIRLMKRLKVAAGISYKKARITSFSDVGHLISTCALLGPDEALPLHILHQKLLTLMSVDLMCRPSDLTRIFRSFKDAGRNEQIRFGKDTSAGTRPRSYYEVRFYDSKELDIGGSRKNSTNDYFSWWVRVYFASKAHLCSGRCLTNFLARSDTSMVPRVDLPHAKIHAHPLFFGPLSPRLDSTYAAPSATHLSSLVKELMDRDAHFGYMTPCNLRGGGSSKCVQLAPDMLSAVVKHCRWTTPDTFNKSYRLPVTCRAGPVICSLPTVTEILRHGVRCSPPVDLRRFNQPPDRWIGRLIPAVGAIMAFDDGVYSVQNSRGRTAQYCHSDLMQLI